MVNKTYVKAVHLKSLSLPIVSMIFILCLVVYSKTAVTAASRGINLWINVVFPSLFPFFVGSELLNKSGIVRAFGVIFEPVMRPLFKLPGCSSFAFIMGVTSGYPVGAKLTSSMYEDKMLSKSEAERLLAFTNNSGPLFVIGAVAVGMFNQQSFGMLLLVCHILACITVGILFGIKGCSNNNKKQAADGYKTFRRFKKELSNLNSNMDFGTVFGYAIKDSIMTLLLIGGFIIFFSVLISLLFELGVISTISHYLFLLLAPLGLSNAVLSGIVSGIFEITTGANIVSKAADAALSQKLIATSAIIGWAGFSVHFQVMGIVKKTGLSIKPYLLGKFSQGIISAIYTYLAIKLINLNLINEAAAFIPWKDTNKIIFEFQNEVIYKYQFTSLIFLASCLLVIVINCCKKDIPRR